MRQIYEYAKMAYRNIMGSKMRSFLTMLGIIIGIGAVIMVLCIGGGGQRMMDSELGMLSSGSVYLSVTGEDTTVNDYFTDGDVEAVGRMEGQKMLDAAKERVFDTKKSISEISCELGFPYPQHFSRWFKKMAGCTPNEYRTAN